MATPRLDGRDEAGGATGQDDAGSKERADGLLLSLALSLSGLWLLSP